MADTIMGLLNPAIAAIFAVVFAGLWTRDRSARAVLVLAIGHGLLAAGFLIFHFASDPNAVSWNMAMHVVYCVSACCVCWAAADRVGQSLPIPTVAAISVIGAGLMIAGSFGDDMNSRLIAANTVYGLFFVLAASAVSRAKDRSPFDEAVFWLLVISAGQFFIRPQVAILVEGPMSAADYRSSDFYAIWMLIMGVVSLMLSLTLVAGTVSDQWLADKDKSETDPLSGLKLRRSFESGAMAMLDKGQERGVPVSIIVADIDHFKRVNDIWGHQAGDEAIAAFGELIGAAVRESDLCGRIGGEEFCILVYNCELAPAHRLAERIRRRFAEHEHASIGPDIRLTASFGVSQWRAGEGYGKLFARADEALYQAKSNGRDRVENSEREAGGATPAPQQSQPANDLKSGAALR